MKRTLGRGLIVVTLMSVLAGCSSSTPASAPGATRPGSGTPSTPKAVAVATRAASSPFGPKLESVTAFWHEHPDLEPTSTQDASILYQGFATGTTLIKTRPPTGAAQVTIVVTCAAHVAYRITYGQAGDGTFFHGGGGDCGGPNIEIFTSPQLEAPLPTAVQVEVPDHTHFAVTIFDE